MSTVDAAPGASAPVEPTVPTGTEQPQPAAGEAESPEGQEPKQDRTFNQKEVDEIVRKVRKNEARRADRAAAERERAARAEAERDFYRQQVEGRSQQQPKGEPLAKDYPTVEAFLRDHYKWQREQEREAEARERQVREPQEHAQRSAEEFSRSLQEKLSEGPEKYDDFEDVVFGDVPFTDPMVAAINESAQPADLAYYLGSHADEVRRISKLPATRQVIELGKIEDRLSSAGKPTTVPAPITPSGTRAKSEGGYRPDMTDKEFAQWRARQKAQRR